MRKKPIDYSSMTYDLVALGNPVYDLMRQVQGITTTGPVLSGCTTNACLAAKSLGMRRVVLAGRIGADSQKHFRKEMDAHGIQAVEVAKSDRSTSFTLSYDDKGERTLKVVADAGKIPISAVWRECHRARNLLIGPVLDELDIDELLCLVQSSPANIFLDPQGLLRQVGSDGKVEYSCDRDGLKRLVGSVDFVKPCCLEATVITGLEDPLESARVLVDWGAKAAIVTMGMRGSIVCSREVCLGVPAYKTTASDPTGAGDVYAGAFLAEYDRTKEIGPSCLYASAAASVRVESVGPDLQFVDSEVRRRACVIAPELRCL